MKAQFEIQINYETSPIEIDEDVFKEGFNEIIDLFYSYYKIGIIPRIGEELIPKAFDVPVTIKIDFVSLQATPTSILFLAIPLSFFPSFVVSLLFTFVK